MKFEELPPPPSNMKKANGDSRFAYVTFLMMNDSYLASALLLAYGLRCQNTKADIVCMVTKEISQDAKKALSYIYDYVVDIDVIYIRHKNRKGREDRPLWFTRLNALRLGPDGDLGFSYEKILILDADVYPLRYFDSLFSLNAPAGMINESKKDCMEYSEDGQYIIPNSVYQDQKWNWHYKYEPICPHGSFIPRELTDRVKNDYKNMGLNGSIYLFQTSKLDLDKILDSVKQPDIQNLVSDKFKWPDMQYFTMYWSGQWTSIDIKFSSFNGYPNLQSICGCHYSGFKPWYFNKKGIENYKYHEDFVFWYGSFQKMIEIDYPQMLEIKSLYNILRKMQRIKVYKQDLLSKEEFCAKNKKKNSKWKK